MKTRPTQFGERENTASSRQHAPRLAIRSSAIQTDPLTTTEWPEYSVHESAPSFKETFALSPTDPEHRKGATGGEESGGTTSKPLESGLRPTVERPMMCEEAAAFVRVHPKTVKRMARRGTLPGYFRFGRWFFYASELDRWMRGELHSPHRPCR
jgi:excisionase family DNA binding protein